MTIDRSAGHAPAGSLPSDAAARALKVVSLNAMTSVLPDLALAFRDATGCALSIRTEGSAVVLDEIAQGARFDVALLMEPHMDAAGALGAILPASRVKVARSGLGVVVRAGRPKPDISTTEGFRRTMLAAASIAHTTRGTSGVHFLAVCERLGIADEVKAKGRTLPTGMVAELVATGEAELAVQQLSELLHTAGTDLVGPFPPELDLQSQVVAAIGAESTHADAAAFTTFLSSPAAAALLRAKGMMAGSHAFDGAAGEGRIKDPGECR